LATFFGAAGLEGWLEKAFSILNSAHNLLPSLFRLPWVPQRALAQRVSAQQVS